jgi:hydrogenase maturation factor
VDPQTSGGLLISVGPSDAVGLVSALKDAGVEDAVDIGEVVADPEEIIRVV